MSSSPYYAVGDVHGCIESLEELLALIPEDARILFIGDLINRGPQSLATLRRIYGLRDRAECILGNHDLHLLATVAGARKLSKRDTIGDILAAPDCEELCEWLRRRPLLIETPDAVFTHSGLAPLWSLKKAKKLAREAEAVLSGPDWKEVLCQMYGNRNFDNGLEGPERIQAILNTFTRMRFVDRKTGELDYTQKEGVDSAPKHLIPWFTYKKRKHSGKTVCFGHWSMLGLINNEDIASIDTGCLWGGSLSAMRFPDRQVISVKCPQWADPFAYK